MRGELLHHGSVTQRDVTVGLDNSPPFSRLIFYRVSSYSVLETFEPTDVNRRRVFFTIRLRRADFSHQCQQAVLINYTERSAISTFSLKFHRHRARSLITAHPVRPCSLGPAEGTCREEFFPDLPTLPPFHVHGLKSRDRPTRKVGENRDPSSIVNRR